MEEIKTEQELNTMSPLVWAYIGDSVYELYIRQHLIETTKLKPHQLHLKAIKYVKAKAQADILNKIKDELSEEELDIVRRGRNSENHHLPKNADVMEYRHATSLEALIGYLYLSGKTKRMNELLAKCVEKHESCIELT